MICYISIQESESGNRGPTFCHGKAEKERACARDGKRAAYGDTTGVGAAPLGDATRRDSQGRGRDSRRAGRDSRRRCETYVSLR